MIEPQTFDWPEAEANRVALLRIVAEAMRRYPGSRLGVGTGWSSPKVLQLDDRLALLEEWATTKACEAAMAPLNRVTAWANVMLAGDEIREHDHGQAIATAIYTVEVDVEAGALILPDRELNQCAGSLILLDGKQRHRVAPYAGDRKTSIVMNFFG